MAVDDIVAAYIDCALWSSADTDEDGNGDCLDALYSADDVSGEARAAIRADVVSFLDAIEGAGLDVSGIEDGQLGHDLWLTRNHHGAGFWDRGLGELGEELTKLANAFGESYLYVVSGTVEVD